MLNAKKYPKEEPRPGESKDYSEYELFKAYLTTAEFTYCDDGNEERPLFRIGFVKSPGKSYMNLLWPGQEKGEVESVLITMTDDLWNEIKEALFPDDLPEDERIPFSPQSKFDSHLTVKLGTTWRWFRGPDTNRRIVNALLRLLKSTSLIEYIQNWLRADA